MRAYYHITAQQDGNGLALRTAGAVDEAVNERALPEFMPGRRGVLDLGAGPGPWAFWRTRRGAEGVPANLSPGLPAVGADRSAAVADRRA